MIVLSCALLSPKQTFFIGRRRVKFCTRGSKKVCIEQKNILCPSYLIDDSSMEFLSGYSLFVFFGK